MKRVIYILTAILSTAAAAVLLIIDYIVYINESGEFYFNSYRDPLIAVLLVFSILSVIQLKKHTPRIMLLLCGYIFIASSTGFGYGYTLLPLAAALTPAIYEFSHYGTLVRQEPKLGGQSRWRWLIAAAIALTAYRVLPFILQVIIDSNVNSSNNVFESYSTDIIGILALVCYAVFCGLMNRRTSALYRMFFTGCIIFDAVQTVFLPNLFSWGLFSADPIRTLFVFFEVLYALFILLILIHALVTKRDFPIPQEHTDTAQQAETPAA